MEKGQHNSNDKGEKDFNIDMGNIDPKITEGYVADTDLERMLKKDISDLDTMRGDRSEHSTPYIDINNKKETGKPTMTNYHNNFIGKVTDRLKDSWNSYIDISGKNFFLPVFYDWNLDLS
jgi:hypothetical protein